MQRRSHKGRLPEHLIGAEENDGDEQGKEGPHDVARDAPGSKAGRWSGTQAPLADDVNCCDRGGCIGYPEL
jgi:hypothetical protein